MGMGINSRAKGIKGWRGVRGGMALAGSAGYRGRKNRNKIEMHRSRLFSILFLLNNMEIGFLSNPGSYLYIYSFC